MGVKRIPYSKSLPLVACHCSSPSFLPCWLTRANIWEEIFLCKVFWSLIKIPFLEHWLLRVWFLLSLLASMFSLHSLVRHPSATLSCYPLAAKQSSVLSSWSFCSYPLFTRINSKARIIFAFIVLHSMQAFISLVFRSLMCLIRAFVCIYIYLERNQAIPAL